jgi:hypothetical protein
MGTFNPSINSSIRQFSMSEVSPSREHHRHPMLVGGGDHFLVAQRPSRLHDGGGSRRGDGVEPVAERDERIRRGD